jgi:AmiR/NasT family two-component response regulator
MTEPAAPIRILVADDDLGARTILVELLQTLRFDVAGEASNGRDAVALARTLLPDVVLLDVHMPDGSGIDAAKEITGVLPATAVVLFTGDQTLSLSEEDVTESAAISLLAKPTAPRALDTALRLAVARTRELNGARKEATEARQALEDRKTIERAKGILQRRTGCSEQEAYRILQRKSQDSSVPMVNIAREVLASEPGLKPPQPRS